jgi:hypothetical protein
MARAKGREPELGPVAVSPAVLTPAVLTPVVLPPVLVLPQRVAYAVAPAVVNPEVVAPAVVAPVAVAPAVVAPVIAPDVAGPDVAAPDVMAQLAVVLGAAVPGGLSGVSSEQALRVVEAVEAVTAWAASVAVEATAVMLGEFEVDFADVAPQPSDSHGTWAWKRFFRQCRSAAAREIQVATGLPITGCQRRVWLAACEPERVRPVGEAMRLGRLSLARALTLVEATAHLDALLAAGIATRVLGPLTGPDGVVLAGVGPLSQATFRARLHRQLVLHHGLVGQGERTHQEAVAARRVSAEAQPDGTGVLVISGDGPRISAAACRVDKIARRLRRDGDRRTLDQLRADVATDLLLGGWIPGDPTFTALGRPPVATVQLIVSLPTLLGLDQGTAQIPGWGWISARQGRQLALAAGSIWKRVVTDPLTGRAIEATAGTYTVPAAMAEQIRTRDGHCRAPGCQIPTEGCDLDHSIQWQPEAAGGPTAETNLSALHRGHHNLKTAGFWDSDQSPQGTLVWTTATGRTITTYPHVYDHPDHLPIKASTLETRHGARLGAVLNPDIPLPGHPNLLDYIDWTQALAPATPQPTPITPTTTADNNQKEQAATAARDPGPPPF